MKFTPEQYRIADEKSRSFIDPDEIWSFINSAEPTPERVRAIIQKSLNKQRLSLADTAVLVQTTDPVLVEEIKEGARELKRRVYGNRMVLFAPLYLGNLCQNNCQYCGFRSTNKEQKRVTLTQEQIVKEVEALESVGQKRLVLSLGEHKSYDAEFLAQCVRTVYSVKKGNGEIRRVNLNAAPLDHAGFKLVHEAGIGTFQIFQETYHPETYLRYHLSGPKRDFDWRLTAFDRAQDVGLDDNGFGVLFGLYDWRYEVLALIRHTNHLEACYNVGPHTISFPRIKDASAMNVSPEYMVNDEDFVKLIAILRLAVPYTGLILTAREPSSIRKAALEFGVSQLDGGTKLEIGSYAEEEHPDNQDLKREQFKINDDRSLAEVVDDLLDNKYIPSFCTACYRRGRTGEHFMEFSVPGFIKRFCTPNAVLTLAEYIVDYASPATAEKGWRLIDETIAELDGDKFKDELVTRLEKIKQGERDLYF
ncbi:[FeFe] hydrogenase H-cluster radical SAM maturase HydG [Acetobacteroides hydrogenigenes]|uniref:2-iminoacetate synthase n=1 Tax=Acetobacteroides hydrogenigenes TaxID=979970 RepID=A0A4V2RPG9_9BACT|nr:[FeFe] hydrogenase H-cluster radical SAM maturase HydG [Acetobacteroides hydrogenigenes]TCN67570.1 2-iminoacetate synthase [Acetobacteroides hydrogenigenes]